MWPSLTLWHVVAGIHKIDNKYIHRQFLFEERSYNCITSNVSFALSCLREELNYYLLQANYLHPAPTVMPTDSVNCINSTNMKIANIAISSAEFQPQRLLLQCSNNPKIAVKCYMNAVAKILSILMQIYVFKWYAFSNDLAALSEL
uniref:Uncharacterized protein n=1 Tax=Glossina austeni TaxID=7395 RepID=A0A1A9UIM2_GLOAU